MDIALIVALLIFVSIFFLNIPIGLGMISASIAYFWINGLDIGIVASKLLDTFYSSYVLIAVPLFIFTAQIMNSGEVTEKIFKFVNALIGKRRGSMGQVNVVASVIFSGMTGSAVADASGLGLMEIDAMKKDGYDAEFSCALTAASATVGPIFPPSIPLVIYAMLSGTSVGALFLGGVVPGLLIGLFLMGYVSWISKRRNYPKGAVFTGEEFVAYTIKALPALITPIILLGGIYTGIVTPTEAGAVAALYSIIIAIFAYKVMSLSKFVGTILDTVKATGMVGIMIGAASGISYIVTVENIPNELAQIMLGITDNKYIFLLIINLAFLVLGMILDTSVLQLVFIPIILPLVSLLGIDLVHFGVIFTLNTMIGLSTPPFGMLLFIVSGISDTDLKGVIKEALPMVLVMIGVLLLITLYPELVLYLPNKLMGN